MIAEPTGEDLKLLEEARKRAQNDDWPTEEEVAYYDELYAEPDFIVELENHKADPADFGGFDDEESNTLPDFGDINTNPNDMTEEQKGFADEFDRNNQEIVNITREEALSWREEDKESDLDYDFSNTRYQLTHPKLPTTLNDIGDINIKGGII